MRKAILLVTLLLAVSVEMAFAQETFVEGTATTLLPQECGPDNRVVGAPSEQMLQEALQKAKINALRTFASSASISVANSFATHEDEILQNIDDYLLNADFRIRCEEQSRNLRVAVKGTLNKSSWDRRLAQKALNAVERSRMTSIFVARKLRSVSNFDDRREVLEQEETINDSAQGSSLGAGGSVEAYGESSETTITTTGGRTDVKAQERQYMLFGNDQLDVAINQGITTLGYRSAPIAQIPGVPIQAFRDDFATGDVISPETLNQAFSALAELPVEILFMVATLDVGIATPSPSGNGNFQVPVSVNAQVYQYDGLFFSTVASVGPTQVQGEERDQVSAERAGLIRAAEFTVSELGSQLQTKNIY